MEIEHATAEQLTVSYFGDVARLTARDQLVPSVATVYVTLVTRQTGCTGGVTRPSSCWWLIGGCDGVVQVVGIFVAVVGRTVTRPCCGIGEIVSVRCTAS